MTTPKESLERARTAINAIVLSTHSVSFKADLDAIDEALASLQGEDAVERVARIPHAEVDKIVADLMSANYSDKPRLAVAIGRAIVKANERGLATGLVPDEAAIRAARDRIARIIDPNAGWGVQLDSDYIDLRHEQAKNEERQRLALTNADTVIAEVLALLPDVAVRADEREKQRERDARVAEAECYATTGRQIAAAIRSNGRGA